MRLIIFSLVIFLFSSCKMQQSPENQFFEAQNENFTYSGRSFVSEEGTELITSGSSVKVDVFGDTVTVFLKNENEKHHYVAVEINNEYQGRIRINNDTLKFALPNTESANTLALYKETEASNGSLIFNGLQAERIKKIDEEKKEKIEFIGNSITCGMGADTSEINCEEGEWFDQHNAFMAYGPRVARALNVDFELNCVSGMGMYRNWNDEDQPVMPEVYPYLHLNGTEGKKVEINKEDAPQIVSIALGTNDLSLGDGEKSRSLFDEAKFKKNYIAFIKHIFDVYPETKIALISSPMVGEKESEILVEILQNIKTEFPDRPIEVFQFERMNGNGCTGHPSVKDHQIMAEKLIPFYRELLKTC